MEIQGEPSSSSNDINQKVEKSEETKEEQEPENKKLKQDELAESTEESQNDSTDTSINDLPTEMLMKILKHVNDTNLIACRLVNRVLRGISTEILSARGEMDLQFIFDEDEKYFKQMIKKKMGEKSLSDFLECFKESKNFYTRFLFKFEASSSSKFENEDWLKFVSYIKDWVKCLKLVIGPSDSGAIEDLNEDLSDLLLNKLPQLEEFGLTFSSETISRSQVQLFPSKQESIATITRTTETEKTRTSITTTTITKLPPVELPHLKVLHLSEILFTKLPRIVGDLLKAAVNLKSIQDFGEHHSSWEKFLKPKDYVFLHSRGKLELLEDAQMTLSVKLFSALKGKTEAFKLKKLELRLSLIYEEEGNWADASTFISDLFESSKDTLKQLTMDPVGFLPDVKFPRFTKLQRFTVESTRDSEIPQPVFPPGIIDCNKFFPVLRTLDFDVDWTTNFPGEEDKIPCIPSAENLRVYDYNLTGNCISKMSKMCPNLEFFKISTSYGDYKINFPEVGRAIWTHMKQLQSLDLQIDLNSEFNTFHSLDSCFTGISVENCKRLYELKKAQKYLKRWKSQSRIAKSELETPVRESMSILDLKDLKSLDIKVDWRVDDRTSEDHLLKRALTCVSESYAFKLMKNLRYYVEKDFDG